MKRPTIDQLFDAERELRAAAIEYANQMRPPIIAAPAEDARRSLRTAARKYARVAMRIEGP